MKIALALALLVPLLLGACSKSYNPGRTAVATPMGADTYVIRANQNAFGSYSETTDFVMLRAAELARGGGYSHFVILSAGNWAKTGSFTTPGSFTAYTTGSATAFSTGNTITAFGSSTTYGTYTPPQTTTYSKPRTEMMVRLLRQTPEDAGLLWFDADQVYAELDQRVRRGSGFLGF